MPASDEAFPGDVFTASAEQEALYVNDCVRQALDVLLHGIRSGRGIVTLVGESGTGKTTLLRYIASHFQKDAHFVFVQNPPDTFDELVDILFAKLGASRSDETRIAVRLVRLGEFLLQSMVEDRRVVLFIDEAQQLSDPVLKQLRLLANLETSHEKLLQIVVCGQPELLDRLKSDEFERLRERITVWAKLVPLRPHEVVEYVTSRFVAAGAERRHYLRDRELRAIGKAADGIPRVVNVLCEHALVNASTRSTLPAGPLDVARAIQGVTGRRTPTLRLRGAFGAAAQPMRRAVARRMRVERSLGMALRSRLPERPTRLAVLMAGCAMGLVFAAASLNIADTGTLRTAWERYGWSPRAATQPASDAVRAPRLVSVDAALAIADATEPEPPPALATAPPVLATASAPARAEDLQLAAVGPEPPLGAELEAIDAPSLVMEQLEAIAPEAPSPVTEELEAIAPEAPSPVAKQLEASESEPVLAAAAEPKPASEAGASHAVRSGVTFAAAPAPAAPAGHAADPGRPATPNRSTAEWCGDGVLDLSEECDDGNGSDSDACLNNCLQAVCGDGIMRGGVEECDDGNARNDDGCLFGCAAARCGDGYVQAGVEICDDGNDIEDDGCSTRCTTEFFVKLPVR